MLLKKRVRLEWEFYVIAVNGPYGMKGAKESSKSQKLLVCISAYVSFWLQNASNKKQNKFVNGKVPRGVAGDMAIKGREPIAADSKKGRCDALIKNNNVVGKRELSVI